MCVLIAVNQLGFGGIVPAMALYARSFDVPHAAIGVAIGVYGLARFLVAIPAGQLADRFGRRAVLALGGVVSAAGNLVCASAPNFATLVTGRFIAGAGAALVLTTGLIVLADITTPSHRGRTMSIYQGAFLFAVGVGPLPGGLLAEHFGLHAPFLSYAGAGLVACVARSMAAGVSGAAPAADVAPPGMNAAAISAYRMLSDFGYVVGPIALGLVTDGLGAGVALTTTAVLLVAVSLLFARGAPETWRAA